MAFLNLVEENRTIRRFDTSKPVTDADLCHCLECVSKIASAGNLQRLRYVTVTGAEAVRAFNNVSLGGYLKKEEKPTASVAPTAYIIITSSLENPDDNILIDVGIAAQTVTLAANEIGIGACMIRNFNKDYFSSLVTPEFPYPLLVIAFGVPAEKSKIVDAKCGESLKYYKNGDGLNMVPKIRTNDLIIRKHT